MNLRPAHLDDIPAMLVLKRELVFEVTSGRSTRGGFLLGTDAEGYAHRIEQGATWVMEGEQVEGFAIVLPDGPFRASDIWERREAVRWTTVDPDAIQHERLCYFDQLAVRRGSFRNRRWGALLAFHALRHVLADHDHVLASTVAEPVLNLAAVPYLRRLGATCVGRIDEVYEPIGPLVSDVWYLHRGDFDRRVAEPRGEAERWVRDTSKRLG